MAGIRFRVLGLSALAAFVVACGSGGGVGDDDAAQPGEDAGNGEDVTVDVTQVDLPGHTQSGLRIVRDILDGIPDVHFSTLGSGDVV